LSNDATHKCWDRKHVEMGRDLIHALAHPYRVRLLHVMNQREASSKEVAREIGANESSMAYHVKELEKIGFVERVRTKQRRGAYEHFYRGTGRRIFSAEEWVLVPEPIRAAVVGQELRITGDLLSESLATETFERRADRHHSLQEALVDEQGWIDAMEALDACMCRIMEVRRESDERRLASDSGGAIRLAVSLLGFECASKMD